MGNCKTCLYWAEGTEGPEPGLHPCGRINEGAVPSVRQLGSVYLESGDYASSDARLYTGEHFGCALFEPGGIVPLASLVIRGRVSLIAGHLKDGTPVYFGTAKPESDGRERP